jgi:hypothetical protein
MYLSTWLAWLAVVSTTQTQPPAANVRSWIETATTATAAKAGIAVPLSTGTLKKSGVDQSAKTESIYTPNMNQPTGRFGEPSSSMRRRFRTLA